VLRWVWRFWWFAGSTLLELFGREDGAKPSGQSALSTSFALLFPATRRALFAWTSRWAFVSVVDRCLITPELLVIRNAIRKAPELFTRRQS
jgi:hypothetical protein